MSHESEKFYDDAKEYWKTIPASVDGMLGGFCHISSTDIAGSMEFLRPFIKGPKAKVRRRRALDCGAGIGRITKRLLLPLFDTVDMVELNQGFLDKARSYIGDDSNRVDQLICSGLQDFTPEENKYDIIWCQWVLGHLTDSDLVTFFKKCIRALTPNGLVMVKENIAFSEEPDFDESDSSVTRPRAELLRLVHQAGLTVIKEEKQKNFPKDIYEVRMFALQENSMND